MILYLDTSALLKRYFMEPHPDDVISIWREASEIVTSSVTYAETLASCHRKKREAGLNGKVFRTIVNTFLMDWNSFIRVEVNDDLNQSIDRIIKKHPFSSFMVTTTYKYFIIILIIKFFKKNFFYFFSNPIHYQIFKF